MAMDPYAGFDDVMVTTRAPRLEQFLGLHECEILKVSEGISPKKKKRWYGAELKIISSDNPSLTPGMLVEWSTAEGQWEKYFMAAIKGFIAYALGEDPSRVKTEHWVKSTSEDQPLAGERVWMRTSLRFDGRTGAPSIDLKTGTQYQNCVAVPPPAV